MITLESIKDVLSSFVFISVIHYSSLGVTGRPVRGSLSRMAGSLHVSLVPRHTSWWHLQSRTLWPQTCPLCTPGGWLECYSTGLFSKCSFQRKPKLTMERGTVGFPPVRKQDAADHARRASRTAQQLELSLCCQYIPEFHHLHKCKGC